MPSMHLLRVDSVWDNLVNKYTWINTLCLVAVDTPHAGRIILKTQSHPKLLTTLLLITQKPREKHAMRWTLDFFVAYSDLLAYVCGLRRRLTVLSAVLFFLAQII